MLAEGQTVEYEVGRDERSNKVRDRMFDRV